MHVSGWTVAAIYVATGVMNLGFYYVADRLRGGMLFRRTPVFGGPASLMVSCVCLWPFWLCNAINDITQYGIGVVKFRNTIQTYRLVELNEHGGFLRHVTSEKSLPGYYSRALFHERMDPEHYYEVEIFTPRGWRSQEGPWQVDRDRSVFRMSKRQLRRTN